MSTITEEQRIRMEENRRRAMQLRAAKQLEKQKQIEESQVQIIPLVPIFCVKKVINAVCRLISRARFTVDVEYSPDIIATFKTVANCKYDPTTRSWSFPVKEHNALIAAIKSIQSDQKVTLTPLPSTIVTVFTNAKPQREIPTIDLSTIDETLTDDLYLFQRQGVCFGIINQGRVLLADDMGLGKTIQAMGICAYYRHEWPLLVIAPSSVRYAWQQSFLRWMPSIDPQSIVVINSGKDHLVARSVLIISYELVAKNAALLLSMNFQVVIVDESHFIKSHSASRTKAILPILKNAKRCCLLSGTPALSRPLELFNQLTALCPKMFPSFKSFGERYCDAKITTFGYDYSGASNMEELRLLLEETMMIRRLKADVLAQLPAKRREMIVLDPKLIDNQSKDMKISASLMNQENLKGVERRGALLQYYRVTGQYKIKAIKNYLSDLLATDRKFLCFAHHRIVLDSICDMLDKKNYKYIRIDGNTSSKDKNRLVDLFQLNDACRVAVLSITAANMGITLTAAHLVIFAELFWNPGILTQAEDRAHRIGQADSVLVQYLVAANTADDYLWPMVSKKLDVLNRAGLSKDNFRDAGTTMATSSKQTEIFGFKGFDLELDEEDLKALETAESSKCDGETDPDVAEIDRVPSKRSKKELI